MVFLKTRRLSKHFCSSSELPLQLYIHALKISFFWVSTMLTMLSRRYSRVPGLKSPILAGPSKEGTWFVSWLGKCYKDKTNFLQCQFTGQFLSQTSEDSCGVSVFGGSKSILSGHGCTQTQHVRQFLECVLKTTRVAYSKRVTYHRKSKLNIALKNSALVMFWPFFQSSHSDIVNCT